VSNHNTRFVGKGETAVVSSRSSGGQSRHIFRLSAVSKRWAGEHGFILTIPNLTIYKGEKVALVGISGCGKSTLLDLLAMVLRPDNAEEFAFFAAQGEMLDIMNAWRYRDLDKLAYARMLHMGYVLQTGGLFPFLSVRDNIGLSRHGLGLPAKSAVEAVAKRLNIERHLDKLPAQLSVGERQRVAIARAMAHEPSVVIADEPTASLDPINADEIMALFTQLANEFDVTLIVATHDWDRVADPSFRRLEFELQQDETEGTVRATVCG
jgi:putative ABC transport system ATP-binding protein